MLGDDHSTVFVVRPDGSIRSADKYDGPMLMAGKGKLQFHVMIKPTGSACNLNCTYCFYLSKANLPDGPGCGRMTDETLELFIRRYIEDVTAEEIVFTWQGGEPTLLGLDFFRRVIELQKKHAKPGQTIHNDLQTNGTLIDEEWCRFLMENRFLVGLSIDGPKHLHDSFRLAKDGSPTFEKVVRAARLLNRFRVPFNTLTSVHRINARHPLDVYRFLRREIGSTCIQFSPIVETQGFERASPQALDGLQLPRDGEDRARPGKTDSIVTDWSVDPEDWGSFLCTIFDEWRKLDIGKVLVNQFETLVSQHLGLGPQLCVYSEQCGKGVAVEHDGSIYSCDHFVYPEYRIGTIRNMRLRDSVLSRPQVKFGYEKSDRLPRYCRQCEYLSDCRGECPKNRILSTPEGEMGLNYLCRGQKTFYAYALPEIERIVANLRPHVFEAAKGV